MIVVLFSLAIGLLILIASFFFFDWLFSCTEEKAKKEEREAEKYRECSSWRELEKTLQG